MKKFLMIISILSIASLLSANNKDSSKDINKKPNEIIINNGGSNNNSSSGRSSGQSNVNTVPGRSGNQTIRNSIGNITINSDYTSQGQNYRQRFIILHYTAIGREGSLKTLTTEEVSAHYLVSDDRNDPVYYLVDESKRAWHAGLSEWKTSKNLNDSSVGIEIVNDGDAHGAFVPYKSFQIKNVAVLVKYLSDKYQIPATNILGHEDIAPQRKSDPGPLFPWKELYKKYNLGMWYDEDKKQAYEAQYSSIWNTVTPSVVQTELKKFGYAIDITNGWDKQTQNVIKVFQHHFRPSKYDGKIDLETFAILKALNEKYNNK
ncbi:N-acetylmuramoyl-L-alanine amidase [Leptotrichia sp. oral taxon 847]|uniref:N-acetylmuramoyl-L-alanine amidase n=1 Tax=Leptotrichia sp. oral taxon 847 TaxID=1785996 RepID=UPI000AFDFDBD|nr:N-acetylmuramoyl-L-alanine amidase [Leptotrichia sp. oral taxon 847]